MATETHLRLGSTEQCAACACPPRQITSNIKNTVTGLKQIVGKKFHSEEIQSEIPKAAYKMVESLGNVTIPVRSARVEQRPPRDTPQLEPLGARSQVRALGEETVMTPEKCMSMMLKTMAKIAEADQGAPVHDCVLAVRRRAPRLMPPPRTLAPRRRAHRAVGCGRDRCRPTSRTRSGTRCSTPRRLWGSTCSG